MEYTLRGGWCASRSALLAWAFVLAGCGGDDGGGDARTDADGDAANEIALDVVAEADSPVEADAVADADSTAAADADAGADSTAEADAEADADAGAALYAGFRASEYGVTPFPGASYWDMVGHQMAMRFTDAAPGGVWILGVISDADECMLSFPSPGGSYPSITFASTDENESYLSVFDTTGVSVWLQVEPGDADVETLIDLVLGRYAGHPSVIGFGVDVEWYRSGTVADGRAVTDDEARAWSERVRAVNPAYTLFLKHWLIGKMPPTFRTGILFLDDSMGLPDLDEMVAEFADWGAAFAPQAVGFQFGYAEDRPWWSLLADPPAGIGQALLDAVGNTRALFWVDFTVLEVFPPD